MHYDLVQKRQISHNVAKFKFVSLDILLCWALQLANI